MSEMESAPVESTPDTSTASIAAEAFETLSHEHTPEPADSQSEPTTTSSAPAAQAEPVKLSAAAQFLLNEGHKKVREDGRRTWFPYAEVEKMLGRYEAHSKTGWEKEFEPQRSEYVSLKENWTKYGPVLQALDLGPDEFLKAVAPHDERFRAYLEARTAAPAAPVQAEFKMPEPDIDLGNGSKTYSIQAIQKSLMDAIAVAEARAEAKAQAALQPITEREKAAAERAKADEAQQAIQTRSKSLLSEAQTWPHFGKLAEDGSLTAFQQSVLDELKADSTAAKAAGRRPELTLEGAYIRCASKLMAEDDATKRARLLAEVNKAARATPSVSKSGAEVPRVQSELSTRDIAAKVLAEQK